MTDRNRALRTLPEGYQFGDARAAAPDHRHEFDRFNPAVNADFCRCGERRDRVMWDITPSWRPLHLNAAEQLQRRAGWNVIEGEDH